MDSELDALRGSQGTGVAHLTAQFGSWPTKDRGDPQKATPVPELERGNSATSVQQLKKYREAKLSVESSSPAGGSQRGPPPPQINLYQ